MKISGFQIPREVYMPIIIIVMTFLIEKILKYFIKKLLNSTKKSSKFNSRKVSTINSLLCNIIRYIVWIFAILSILSVFGVNTTAIITGLGVASFVIGLAFQDILKDILAGASILFENQFAIGDLVKIGDFTGYVIFLGLKTTKLKAITGEIKIISNRNITEIINYSMENTIAMVDLPVCYEADISKVEKIIKEKSKELVNKIPYMIGEVMLLGVEKLDDSAVVFRITAECKPAKHFIVERELRKEFKIALDKNNIKIPYMQIEVHNEK